MHKTNRQTRSSDHIGATKNNGDRSDIAEHSNTEARRFELDQAKGLASVQENRRRIVQEAICNGGRPCEFHPGGSFRTIENVETINFEIYC